MINPVFLHNRIINADNMAIMPQIPDKYFDLCITDPPYGINIMQKSKIGSSSFHFEKKKWDNATPDPEVFEEIFRISKNQIIFGMNYFDLPPTRCFVFWDKGPGMRGRSFADGELIWTSFDENARMFTYGSYMEGTRSKKIHPTQKPEYVLNWLLSRFAKSGDKVIDPFAGSCSVAAACKGLGITYCCIEKEKDYVEEGTRLVENTTSCLFISTEENENETADLYQ